MDCMDKKKQIVVPIFYDVDPSDIRKLKKKFAEAFAKHEQNPYADQKELETWKTALTRIADLSGWDSRQYKDDIELIEKIVGDILEKWIHIPGPSSLANNLVGMDHHVNEVSLRLCRGKNDVGAVGIWGMGGIGKTTIARAVYDKIAHQFEHKCFFYNVKERFPKKDEAQMRGELLSMILKGNEQSVDIFNQGSNAILERLGKKKVLVVLDDLETFSQIEALLGDFYSFGVGSRILVTTRDKESVAGVYETYEPRCLNHNESLELLMKHAFRTNQPSKEYSDLSNRAIEYAQGLPLALKVLGASLDDKSIHQWKELLEKIKKIPERKIMDVLRTSFEGLDDLQKEIFLDIACLFREWDRDLVTEILDSCGFYPHNGLRVLVDRALITISEDDDLSMHDLLQEMGREIVRLESTKEPGKRSRLWSCDDVIRVLTQNTATDAVECLMLDMSDSKDDLSIDTGAIVRMTKLRLIIYYSFYSIMDDTYKWKCEDICPVDGCKQLSRGDLESLSHELRFLLWHGCPLKSLPSTYIPKNLVHLDMRGSHIEQLWEGTKPLQNLKVILLSHCQYLVKIPDFTEAINLEKLFLDGCSSLFEIDSSISALQNLDLLDLNGCKQLQILPSCLHMKSLRILYLSGCSNLVKFPEIGDVMTELKVLYLDGTAIKELPSSINSLTRLRDLHLKDCTELKTLPRSIHMSSLQTLNLNGCPNLENFPEISGIMKELRELLLDETAIKGPPSSIDMLLGIKTLSMRNCRSLVFLPDSICNLPALTYLDLRGCTELKTLLTSIHISSLQILNLNCCSNLEKFPEISGIMELSALHLDETAIKGFPSSIDLLEGLELLSMQNCKGLVSLPDSICNLTALKYLDLRGCTELKTRPTSIHMSSLQILNLNGCPNLENFPEISGIMKELSALHLDGTAIKGLPSSIDMLPGIKKLSMRNCKGLVSLPDSICNSAHLTHLSLIGCTELKTLSTSIHMSSLQILYLDGCSNLEKFPEISGIMKELSELHLDETAIKEMPSSVDLLEGLKVLSLQNCKGLVSLPDSICNSAHLTHLSLIGCTELKTLSTSIHMSSLQILYLDGCSNLEKFPEISGIMKELSELHLDETAIKELPSSVDLLEGLKVLSMQNCKGLVSLPDSICNLAHLTHLYVTGCTELKTLSTSIRMSSLQILHLNGCSNLEKFPEISGIMKELSELCLDGTAIKGLPSSIDLLEGLKVLSLQNCKSLVSLPDSICNSERLTHLSLIGCTELKTLSTSIHISSLQILYLDGCSNLEKFPEISGIMKELSKLRLDGTAIKGLPSSIDLLEGLKVLSLQNCKGLVSLPDSICNSAHLTHLSLIGCTELKTLSTNIHMSSLQILYLDGCSNLEKFPEISGIMKELSELCLDGTAIKGLPSSIDLLEELKVLSLQNCKGLVSLPDSICNSAHLTHLYVTGCTELKTLSTSIQMSSLQILYLDGCSNLEMFPEISGIMKELSELRLDETAIKRLSSSIDLLEGLKVLSLQNCKGLVSLLDSICNSAHLTHLSLIGCTELKTLSTSIHMSSLQILYLDGCSNLEKFPEISGIMKELSELCLDGTAIKGLPSSIDLLPGIKKLSMRNCKSLESLPDSICNLPALTHLDLKDCTELKTLPRSIHMSSLQTLNLNGCPNLENFPEISRIMKELSALRLDGTAIKGVPSSIDLLPWIKKLSMRNWKGLVSLPDSICNVPALTHLSLIGCTELKTLPRSIHMSSLQILYLDGCSNLEKFPEISGIMELSALHLDETAIKGLPSSIDLLEGLKVLSLQNCKGLVSLPESICNSAHLTHLSLIGCTELKTLSTSIHLSSLQILYLDGCSNLEKFPEISGIMELSALHLDETAIKGLPSSIDLLEGLELLSMQNCKGLVSLPDSICNLTALKYLDLRGCTELKTLSTSIHMSSLQILYLDGCSNLEKFPEISGIMKELSELCLDGTAIKGLPSSIDLLPGIKKLSMRNCKSLESLPDSICNLPALTHLDLKDCIELKTLPRSIHMSSLQTLNLNGCPNLENFPEISGIMKELSALRLDGTAIKGLPSSIDLLEGLKVLSLQNCKGFVSLPDSICNSAHLTHLSLIGCTDLKTLSTSIQMSSLQILYLDGCSNLEKFPEISGIMKELSELRLDWTAIKGLPSSIDLLEGLKVLSMQNCKGLVSLPDNIYNSAHITHLFATGCTELKTLSTCIHMSSLQILDLKCCSNLEKFPEISGIMKELSVLHLDETAIKGLPSSIDLLEGLKILSMQNCKGLVSLPDSICNLAHLTHLYVTGCTELKTLSTSIRMSSLQILDLNGCSNFEQFPEISGIMKELSELLLDETAIKGLPSSIDLLPGIKKLSMRNCKSLESLPDSICNLALTHLDLTGCVELKALSTGIHMSSTQISQPDGCSNLDKFPEISGFMEGQPELRLDEIAIKGLPLLIDLLLGIKKMRRSYSAWPSSMEEYCSHSVLLHLDLSDCNLLELSDGIAQLYSLKTLKLCKNNLESLPVTMNRLGCLMHLELEACKRLKSIPELSSSINYIDAHDCTALETFSKPKPPHRTNHFFTFCNCLQLVQTNLFRDIVEKYVDFQDKYLRPLRLKMCLPGSEVPDWFTHRSRGFSVSVQLLANWLDRRFLGFAICAVLKYQEVHHYTSPFSDTCLCTFKGRSGECSFSFDLLDSVFRIDRILQSDHMFQGYVSWSECHLIPERKLVNETYTEATFQIVVESEFKTEQHRITSCGVRFVYADQDEMPKLSITPPQVHVDSCGTGVSSMDTCEMRNEETERVEITEISMELESGEGIDTSHTLQLLLEQPKERKGEKDTMEMTKHEEGCSGGVSGSLCCCLSLDGCIMSMERVAQVATSSELLEADASGELGILKLTL